MEFDGRHELVMPEADDGDGGNDEFTTGNKKKSEPRHWGERWRGGEELVTLWNAAALGGDLWRHMAFSFFPRNLVVRK